MHPVPLIHRPFNYFINRLRVYDFCCRCSLCLFISDSLYEYLTLYMFLISRARTTIYLSPSDLAVYIILSFSFAGSLDCFALADLFARRRLLVFRVEEHLCAIKMEHNSMVFDIVLRFFGDALIRIIIGLYIASTLIVGGNDKYIPGEVCILLTASGIHNRLTVEILHTSYKGHP
jgi:hypothetical protein